MINAGDFAAGSTVRIPWNTYGADGASITRSSNGTIRIYKDGSDVQRSSAAGVTDNKDFDSVTGAHLCVIDLSNNEDEGFYEAGSDYTVMCVGAVVDTKIVNPVIGTFSIMNRALSADSSWIQAALDSNEILDDMVEDNAGVFRFTAAALVNAAGTSASAVADAVWNRLTSAITTTGSIGKYILDKLSLIGATNIPVNQRIGATGDVYLDKGISQVVNSGDQASLEIVSEALTGIVAASHPCKLHILARYGSNERFVVTVPTADITVSGSRVTVNIANILTNARTTLLPVGDWEGRTVFFKDSQYKLHKKFTVHITDSKPAPFDYDAADTA